MDPSEIHYSSRSPSDDEQNSKEFEDEDGAMKDELERLKDLYSGEKLGKEKIKSSTTEDEENSDGSFSKKISQISTKLEEEMLNEEVELNTESKNSSKMDISDGDTSSGSDGNMFSSEGGGNLQMKLNYKRYGGNDDANSTGNERCLDNYDVHVFPRIQSIIETNDRLVITLNKVTKRTVIEVLDSNVDITCERKEKEKRKSVMMEDGQWGPRKTCRKTHSKIIITPKNILKIKVSQKRRSTDATTSPKVYEDPDFDKENHRPKKVASGRKGSGARQKDASPANRSASSTPKDDIKETSVRSKEESSLTQHSPSPSSMRAKVGIGRKKIRMDDEDSDKDLINEYTSTTTDEEKTNS